MRGMLVLLIVSGGSVGAVPPPTASAELASRGLIREGTVWIVPAEAELRRQLAALPALEKNYLAAAERFTTQRARLERAQAQLAAARLEKNRLDKLRQSEGRNARRRQQLAQEAQQWAAVIAQLEVIAGRGALYEHPALQTAAIERLDAHDALLLCVLAVRRAAAELPDLYAPLRGEAALAALLDAQGPNHRLGPVRDYRRDLQTLQRPAALVFGEELPAVYHGQHWLTSAVFAERFPVAMQIGEEPGIGWLTHNAAQAAGIAVPADAPRQKLTLPGGRTLEVPLVRAATMRLGKWLLRDVELAVLPPAAEDVGSRLGRPLPGGLTDQLVPELCLWRLRPAGASATRSAGSGSQPPD